MYAIIKTGGKQYKVENGDTLFIEKLPAAQDDVVTFENVLALSDDSGLKVGTPYLDGITVEGKVLKNGKARKITVFTYKPKKNQKRKLGHRQPYTKVMITAIGDVLLELDSTKVESAEETPVEKTVEVTKETKETKETKKPAKKAATSKTESKDKAPAEKKPARPKSTKKAEPKSEDKAE